MLRWELIKAWVRAEAELGVFSDEVVEEMEWLDKRITRMCESNGWPTGEQLLDFRREDQAD